LSFGGRERTVVPEPSRTLVKTNSAQTARTVPICTMDFLLEGVMSAAGFTRRLLWVMNLSSFQKGQRATQKNPGLVAMLTQGLNM